jgi:ABC-2 type transport system ATP-binding protein
MKRRLNLAAALLHDPQLVLLDEPTVGVDPQSRNAIFDNLEGLRKRGKTLLYTTHYMEEAERLCDRLVIMDRGKLIANDTLKGLHGMLPRSIVLIVELQDGKTDGLRVEELRRMPGIESAEIQDGTVRVGLSDLTGDSAMVLQWLAERGHRAQHVASERVSLESVFLSLTGRKLRD